MNNAPLWRMSLEKIFPTEEDFMWNKNSPLSRLWYQIDNAPLWRILLEKIFPTEMDFMWNEKFPTVEDIVSKKFFATTEDLLLIPNKNLLQLNSDRVRCGEFFNSSNFLKKVPHDGCQARFYVCILTWFLIFFLQVFNFDTGSLYSLIDSHGCKMKRPTGLAVMNDRHLVVVDIGNDCVRKYRYFWARRKKSNS